MSGASFRKIRFSGPGRRLAASEAPKIGGGASLARREKLRFPAIRQEEGFQDFLSELGGAIFALEADVSR